MDDSKAKVGKTDSNDRLYTREEVQRWRDDVAQAAADMVERASLSFGGGDWSWLVKAIRDLSGSGQK